MNSSYNKATTFIRPLLGLSNSAYTNNYKNCYITQDSGVKIHLVFENLPQDVLTDAQKETFQALNENALLEEKSIYKNCLVYSFNVDEDMSSDIQHFMNGKYSQMSEGGKQMIMFSQHDDNNVAAITSILWPTEEDRKNLSARLNAELSQDAEIFSKPNLQEELFNMDLLC
jgi:hypothetical protein